MVFHIFRHVHINRDQRERTPPPFFRAAAQMSTRVNFGEIQDCLTVGPTNHGADQELYLRLLRQSSRSFYEWRTGNMPTLHA